MTIPTLESIKALDGRVFAMLSTDEQAVFHFYYAQGRKFDVAIAVRNEADPAELAGAASRQEAGRILKSANSRVSVMVGPAADKAWLARV